VDVRVGGDEELATIAVADTGIGLSQAEAERLFRDFVRIKNEKTRNVTGSGLGLSIVRKIAQLYGGGAHVESQPDVGSTFSVELRRNSPSKDTP
jgi:two-component system, sensor histidine kinase and response regulator